MRCVMVNSTNPGIARVAWITALLTFVIHLVANPHYGFFRDELYFIICGFHPAWGYVDQPPIVPLLAAGSQLFGHSLLLLRAVAALFAAGCVYVTCFLVAELGGSVFAALTASLLVFFSPVLMNFGMKVSTDMPGLVLWPLIALFVLRLVRGADSRLWLVVGALLGLSLESKYSVIFFAVALVFALLILPQRKALFSPWFLAGAGLAFLIVLPNALWQMHYDWPMWQLLQAGQHGKNVIAGPLLYIIQEFLITNILFAPLLIAGIIVLLRHRDARFLGLGYLVLIALMILFHGKHYYPANIYPIVFAGSGIALAAWTNRLLWLRPLALAFIIIAGTIFTPFSLPILSEAGISAYTAAISSALHIGKTLATEHGKTVRLEQDYADMHGWRSLAHTVEAVYAQLPAAQQKEAVIAASNYGEASAIVFFGHNLPPVISGHNNFWIWGTHGVSGNVVIDVNGDCGHGKLFASQRLLTRFSNPWGVADEDNIPIMLCTGIKTPIQTLWPRVKKFI